MSTCGLRQFARGATARAPFHPDFRKMGRTRRTGKASTSKSVQEPEAEADTGQEEAAVEHEDASDFELSEDDKPEPVRRKKPQRKKTKKALKNVKGRKGLLKKALDLPPEIFMTVRFQRKSAVA